MSNYVAGQSKEYEVIIIYKLVQIYLYDCVMIDFFLSLIWNIVFTIISILLSNNKKKNYYRIIK